MFNSKLNKEELFALLESSMSDFENTRVDKIIKAAIKIRDNQLEYENEVIGFSLTEGVLFPKDIKTELISPLRLSVNEYLYQNFTYHNLYKDIDAQPYNIKEYYWKNIEKIFIDSYFNIETIYTNLYKNILEDMKNIEFKDVLLKSQGINFYFNNLNEFELFVSELEQILINAYNRTIVESLKNNEFMSIKYTSIFSKKDFFIKKSSYFNVIHDTIEVSGEYQNLRIESFDDTDIFKVVNNLDKQLRLKRDIFLYKDQTDDSVLFIPENKSSKYVHDHGYFNSKDAKKLINLSRENYSIGSDVRRNDYNYLIENINFL